MSLLTDTARRVKSYDLAQLKAEGDGLEAGQFWAYAAVFGNVDSYGERLNAGAFTKTLGDWKASGDPIPVIWHHQWADANAHVGYVVDALEDEHGLRYKGQLDVDDPYAMKVHKLLKGRRVRQQSFGFDIESYAETKEDDRWILDILQVKLFEVGPCLVGVNQETSVVDVKSSRHPQNLNSQGNPAASAPSQEPDSTPDAPASRKGHASASSLALAIAQLELASTEEDY